jgi:hypothetical protein
MGGEGSTGVRGGDVRRLGLSEQGVYRSPAGPPTGAVLVLSGSSGRVESERAALLAAQGLFAVAIRWFGGPGQPADLCEVPLESFRPAVDVLAERASVVGILGTSRGAEAALLVAAGDARIRVVTAVAPTHVVWPGFCEEEKGEPPHRSAWTREGRPLPFVRFAPGWFPDDPLLPSFRSLYLDSMTADERATGAAVIPVERIRGHVIVAAGGDDRVWPSAFSCQAIAGRRTVHGLDTERVLHPGAGHRCLLPGERPARGGQRMARGGDETSAREWGTQVHQAMLRAYAAA